MASSSIQGTGLGLLACFLDDRLHGEWRGLAALFAVNKGLAQGDDLLFVLFDEMPVRTSRT
jgi:hypothetical protein